MKKLYERKIYKGFVLEVILTSIIRKTLFFLIYKNGYDLFLLR